MEHQFPEGFKHINIKQYDGTTNHGSEADTSEALMAARPTHGTRR
jgi:hypothetical protein